MAHEPQTGAGIDRIQALWSRRKWLAILVFAVPFSLVAGLASSLPSVYQSKVTLLVERQQVPEQMVRPTVTAGVENRLQTISQELLSRSRLEPLILRFGLYTRLRATAPLEEAIERMRKDILLEPQYDTSQKGRATVNTIAFTITYWGIDATTVAQVANTLASSYIEENLKARERQATGTSEFLRVQVEDVKKRLDVLESRITEFKKRFIGELPEQMQANLSTLERLNTQLRLNSDRQTRALERRESLRKQLAELPGGVAGPKGAPDAGEVRLVRLKQELTELRTRFSERYPDVVRLKAEIAALELELTEAKPEAKDTASVLMDPNVRRLRENLAEVEGEIKTLKNEEGSTRTAIATYQRRVEETPRREGEFRELTRDLDSTREDYHSLLKRYSDAQLAEDLEQRQKGEQFRIIEPAVPSEKAATPVRLVAFLAGLVLCLGVSVATVMITDQVDTSFRSVDDLRAFTSVPILLSIPRIVTAGDLARRRRRFRLSAAVVVLVMVAFVWVGYHIANGNEVLAGLLAGRKF